MATPSQPQFLLTVFHDAGVHEEGAYQTDEEMQAAFARVNAFNEDLQASGQFVFACGLTPPEEASQVTAGATATPGPVGQGPFVGGFWIINAADREEAEAIAARGAEACAQPLEVRQLAG